MQEGSFNFRVFLHKGRRNEAGECRRDRFHSQRTHPVEYLVLEFNLAFVPGIGERSVEGIEVSHPVPRQMCRSGKESIRLLGTEAELHPHSFGNGLACYAGKGHIHSVQGHPVQLIGPSVPIPICAGVAEGADIQEIT